MTTTEQLHSLFLSCGGRICTDSRSLVPGDLFWALKGENFDGNDFAVAALEQGAAAAVVDSDSAAASCGLDGIVPVSGGTLRSLWALAAYHREHTLHDGARIPMLALTGTNGKTTTKELIRCVLATKFALCATAGNLNNNIGVPLTVLGLRPEHDFALIEMGASHPGDIRELVDIAHPDYGLITNVGRAHLLGFGSFEGVCRTKGEMYDYVSSVGGQAFVNADNPTLMQMARERGVNLIPYGASLACSQILPTDADNPFLGLKLTLGGEEFTLRTSLVGSYNADNALAALAVGLYFGVPADDAVRAISSYVPQNNRSQMLRTQRNTLIVDAYNANPSSMAAALDNFAAMLSPSKIVCLGDMLELGVESQEEHQKVVRRVMELAPAEAVLVGDEFAAACTSLGIPSDGCPVKFSLFGHSSDAAQYVRSRAFAGCAVLVKGSRGTRMETVIPEL